MPFCFIALCYDLLLECFSAIRCMSSADSQLPSWGSGVGKVYESFAVLLYNFVSAAILWGSRKYVMGWMQLVVCPYIHEAP